MVGAFAREVAAGAVQLPFVKNSIVWFASAMVPRTSGLEEVREGEGGFVLASEGTGGAVVSWV